MRGVQRFFVCATLALVATAPVAAEIFRWDTGEIIPGTEGVTPTPGIQVLGGDLAYAGLAQQDLRDSSFIGTNLTHSTFQGANLSSVRFHLAILRDADLSETHG